MKLKRCCHWSLVSVPRGELMVEAQWNYTVVLFIVAPQIPRVNLTVRTYSVQHIVNGLHKQLVGIQ